MSTSSDSIKSFEGKIMTTKTNQIVQNNENLPNIDAKIISAINELVDNSFIQTIPFLLQNLDFFKDTKQIIAFKLTDGITSCRDIGKAVNLSHQTIANWWSSWVEIGIAEKFGSQGQIRKKYSFLELIALFGKVGETKND